MAASLRAAVAGLSDPKERARFRASAHTRSLAGQTFRHGKYKVRVLRGPDQVEINGALLLQLEIQIWQGNRDVTPPDLNPWRIFNPPLLTRNRTEDPSAALQECLFDLVDEKMP